MNFIHYLFSIAVMYVSVFDSSHAQTWTLWPILIIILYHTRNNLIDIILVYFVMSVSLYHTIAILANILQASLVYVHPRHHHKINTASYTLYFIIYIIICVDIGINYTDKYTTNCLISLISPLLFIQQV